MKLLLSSSALAALLAFVTHVAGAEEACIESLDVIYASEKNVTDDRIIRLYHLCPNTTFTVASSYEEDGTPSEGQYPLTLARSNVHILCGVDGKSSNNCILEDGHEQLRFYDDFDTGLPVTNVEVQGLTFTKARTMNVIGQNNGNLTLIDCIFKDNENLNILYVTSSNETDESHDFTSVSGFDVHITISGCVFTDNVIWSYSGSSVEGLVRVRGGSLEVLDTTFVRTTLNSAVTNILDYIFLAEKGDLAISNTCFLDNDDSIAPIVNGNGTLQLFSNSVHRNTTTLPSTGCAFVSHGIIESSSTFHESSFFCEAADVDVCTADTVDGVRASCFDSMNDIYDVEEMLETDLPNRTYRLCPGTEYRIRSFDAANDDDRDNTTYPLILGQSNVRILCGSSGKSSNDCILSGGTYQVAIHDEYRAGTYFENILVQGLTFTKATSTNVLTNSNNDVTLKDCVFKGNDNQAIILIDLSETEFGRVVQYRKKRQRTTIEDNDRTDPYLQLTVLDSLFVDNVVGSSSDTSSGLITSHRGNLELLNNTFYGTKLSSPSNGVDTVGASDEQDTAFIKYIVANLEGNLKLAGNCFTDNDVTVAPVISYKGSLWAAANGGAASDSQDRCEFLAVINGDDSTHYDHAPLTSDVSYSCSRFDVSGCDPSYPTDNDEPRGIPANVTFVDLSSSQSPLSRPGASTAIFCFIALVVALVVAFFVVGLRKMVSQRRAGRTPVTPAPTFQDTPIPALA